MIDISNLIMSQVWVIGSFAVPGARGLVCLCFALAFLVLYLVEFYLHLKDKKSLNHTP